MLTCPRPTPPMTLTKVANGGASGAEDHCVAAEFPVTNFLLNIVSLCSTHSPSTYERGSGRKWPHRVPPPSSPLHRSAKTNRCTATRLREQHKRTSHCACPGVCPNVCPWVTGAPARSKATWMASLSQYTIIRPGSLCLSSLSVVLEVYYANSKVQISVWQ